MIKQRGIALIQVLLITAILSVLALYLTTTAKNQVMVAQWTNDKADALVAMHSAESNLLFTLLTEPKTRNSSTPIDNSVIAPVQSILANWNFFNKPFAVNQQVSIAMQDQSALINLHFPNRDILTALIISQGYSSNQANVIVDNLLDWQDLDSIPRVNGFEGNQSDITTIRNGALPSVYDLRFIEVISPELQKVLINNSTIYSKGSFNPTNSPLELLIALSNAAIARQVIELRETKQLTKRKFTQLTGIRENDDTFFYPSNYVSITLSSRIGDSVIKKIITIHISPYAQAEKLPINVLSTHG